MATLASAAPPSTRSDHKFFMVMACVMAAVIVAGFGLNLAVGRSNFGLPLLYHIHAFVFFGWVALYLTQNTLVANGAMRLHKRLGWLALGWIPAMVVLGTLMTVHSLQKGAPFFFDANEFLFGNPLGLLYFATMAGTAIRMRRRTDWHRRLMYCAMASLTGPGFGRLLPMPFIIPWSWWTAAFVFPVIFPLIGVIADKRRTGRVHPAWKWGIGGLFAALLLADLIAYSPIGQSIAAQVVAGTPGAARPMHAFLPPGL